jgi:hypothetical protein
MEKTKTSITKHVPQMRIGLIITGNSSVLLMFNFRFLVLEVIFTLNIYHIYRFRGLGISLQALSIYNMIMKIRLSNSFSVMTRI